MSWRLQVRLKAVLAAGDKDPLSNPERSSPTAAGSNRLI